MHYTRKYQTGTRAERTDAALADCKEWFGKAYSKKVALLAEHVRDCRARGYTRRQIHDSLYMLCGIGGVSGYWPVRAITRDILRKLNEREVAA